MKVLAFTKRRDFKISDIEGFQIDQSDSVADVEPKLVSQNNADLLIIDYPATAALKKEKNFKHAEYVLVPLGLMSLVSTLLYGFRYLIRGRLKFVGLKNIALESGKKLLCLSLKTASKKKHLSERSYFPSHWSNRDFLDWMDHQDANYVVMRWYDDVVAEKDMNDIDILIDDKDIPVIRAALKAKLGTRPVDLHALSGGETGGIDKMAYFPPAIGSQILGNKITSVNAPGHLPSPLDEFRSLAYHALFRKGHRSGLQQTASDHTQPSGKIYKRLIELKEKLDLDVELNMKSLLEFLYKEGWVPPSDMLAKLATNNEWIQETLAPNEDVMAGLKAHYFAIILREISEAWQMTDKLVADIQKAGFQLLYQQKLDEEEKSYLEKHVRGGNWSAGPWPVSGGGPSTVLIVVDTDPIPLNRDQRKNHKSHKNARILFKQQWRLEIDKIIGKENSANFVHTSDNNLETLEYVQHFPKSALDIIHNFEKKL